MEQPNEIYDDKDINGPIIGSDVDDSIFPNEENGQLTNLPVINDKQLDSEIEPTVKRSDFSDESLPSRAIQSQAEIDTFAGSERTSSVEKKYDSVDSLECSCQGVGTEHFSDGSKDTESDQVARSSTMTSPTTTTGTFTLPTHSPGTEEDLTEEMFPVDQAPPTFRDPLERIGSSPPPAGLDGSEISLDVFLDHERSDTKSARAVDTASTVEDIAAMHVHSDVEKTSEEQTLSSGDAVVNLSAPGKQESPIIVVDENILETERLLEEETDGTDGNTHLPDTSTAISDGESKLFSAGNEEDKVEEDLIEEQSLNGGDLQNESIQSTSEVSTEPLENEAYNDDISIGPYEIRLPPSTDLSPGHGYSIPDIPTGGDAIVSQDVVEDGLVRKISTDEEEYSGYDIDIGDPSSYQDEFSIAEEDCKSDESTPLAEFQGQQACDNENVPLFVDVKYSVGEQIHPGVNTVYDAGETTPTDEQGESDDGQDASFPFDQADTMSTRSSVSETVGTFDEEASVKIAEETVAIAMKKAYEIARNMPTEDYNDHSATPSEGDNITPLSEGHHAQLSGEDVTLDPTEVICDVKSVDQPISEIEGENAHGIFYSHPSEVRENDITRIEETYGEKMTAIEAAEVQSEGIEESAAVGLVNSEADAVLAVDHQQEEQTITRTENENRTERGARKESVDREEEFKSAEGDDIIQPSQDEQTKIQVLKNGEESETHEQTETEEGDMVKANESSENTRHFPERITYNPALSPRNTEATKWFGQPTAEDKIWMKPSGKVDESAEHERKKLIKAMTRKHNPRLVPKWQPPMEKDFSEDRDEKQKDSLKKYEERRRSRSDASFKNRNDLIQSNPHANSTSAPPDTTSFNTIPKENIVTESVVHSRAAIGVWESRLSEKQKKEELERQRLSVGKQKRHRDRTDTELNRTRHDSSSSVSSTASGVLPTSEHIERESMNISKVRNRWRDIEEESNEVKPTATKKEGTTSKHKFSVNTGSTFRSSQTPTPMTSRPVNVTPINRTSGGPVIRTAHEKESFIDKEIREAAEREERWKQEQWDKTSEISAASSEDVFPENITTPASDPEVIATVYTRSLPPEDVVGLDIMEDANREEIWKAEHSTSKLDPGTPRHRSKDSSGVGSDLNTPPPQHQSQTQIEMDSESLSSYGSSGAANELSSPPPLCSIAREKVNFGSKTADSANPGVDCNSSGVEVEASEKAAAVTKNNSPSRNTEGEEDRIRRQRIASLTSVVAPRGWEPAKNRAVVPLSHVSPVLRSVPKPEVKSPVSPRLVPISEWPVVKNEMPKVSSTPAASDQSANNMEYANPKTSVATPKEEKQNRNTVVSPTIKSAPVRPVDNTQTRQKKGGPVFQKIEVSSSKSKLQTIMQKEMQDAAAREEEWHRKQLELVSQGVDVSPHPVVHSTREIRTPSANSTPPPVNTGQPVPQRRIVKSLFTNGDEKRETHIRDDVSDEHKKRVVVKAMRVPKRKSQLAMRWEEGEFQNNIPDEDD